MARCDARLQIMVHRFPGTLSPLCIQPRTVLRLAIRVTLLVDPPIRIQNRFHASIYRSIPSSIPHPDSHSTLL
ncbi:hypothetical protein RYX36_015563 [Vicia faba]